MTIDHFQKRSVELEQRCVLLERQNAELVARVKWFEEQIRLSQQHRFGSSSEKTVPGQKQLLIFNEAEAQAQPLLAEPTVETITYTRQKKQHSQRELMLKDLPVETIEHRPPVEEQVCPCCGGSMHEMSTEVRQ